MVVQQNLVFVAKLKLPDVELTLYSGADASLMQELMKQVKDWLIYYNNQRIQTKLPK